MFVPFLHWRRPTALYHLSKERYGKYFEPSLETGGALIEESWFKTKWNLQMMYQHEMEEQGAILRAIFLHREATEDTKVVDYLLWVSFVWELYQRALKDEEFEDEGFIRFVQSDLSLQEEFNVTFKFRKANQPD